MPLLLGKSGVGKTTILRILAQRVVEGHVPHHFRCRVIRLTEMGKRVSILPYLSNRGIMLSDHFILVYR